MATAVAAGKLECDEYTQDETLAIQATLDNVRTQLGVVYAPDSE